MTFVDSVASVSIPPVSTGKITEERHSVLLWVRTGEATVDAGGRRYRITTGEAIWVPFGIQHSTHTDPGTVVVPLFSRPDEKPDALSGVQVLKIPPGWEDWLISALMQGWHFNGARSRESVLSDLFRSVLNSDDAATVAASAPPMPRSREARDVAGVLLHTPETSLSLTTFAAQSNIAVSSLQRQFLSETGMPFSAWRTRVRIAAAATLLVAGYDVASAGRATGYATPAGFTKAFRKNAGCTPKEYTDLHRDDHSDLTSRASVMPTDVAVAVPPPIAPWGIWSRINASHVLLWVYRGTVEMQIGSRNLHLRQGQAVWAPAGMSISIHAAVDSILLPLGELPARPTLRVQGLRVYTFPVAAELQLLHITLAAYTLLRPEAGNGHFVRQVFRDQILASHADTTSKLTGVIATISTQLRRNPADGRSLADWAIQLGLTPRELGREFLDQTDTTFPSWRAQLRMDVARLRLMLGDTPGVVARHLGYSSVSAFSNAFTAAHGMTPRQYQWRERH